MSLELYDSIKADFRTGDLLAWESHSLIGFGIRLIEPDDQTQERIALLHPEVRDSFNPNHASSVIRLHEYEGPEIRRFCLEAMENGVVLNLVSRRLEAFNGRVWWFPLLEIFTDDARREMGHRLLENVGCPYDYPAIARNIFGHVPVSTDKLFCSELHYLQFNQDGPAPRPNELLSYPFYGEGRLIYAS